MKARMPVLALLLLLAPPVARAQDAAPIAAAPATPLALGDEVETPAPGNTDIDADEMRSDQDSHVTVFTGNVVVTGTSFTMHCQEMTVIFTKENKVDHIVAVGDVVINQPGRVTHCGHAEYYHDEDKFILTEQPVINDGGNIYSAPKYTLYRSRNLIVSANGRTKTVIKKGNDGGLTTPNPTTPVQTQ